MKKIIAPILFGIFVSGCGVTINSVVDGSVTEPYRNPLIVIPYAKYKTENFSDKLKQKIEAEFQNDQKEVEVLLVEKSGEGLALNSNEDMYRKINDAIAHDEKDLLLIFNPTNLYYYNGGLQTATYELVGIDTRTKKEVWKAKFSSGSSFGPAMFAEESAKKIYERLKADNIL